MSKDSILQSYKPRKYVKLSNEMIQELKVIFNQNQYPTKEVLNAMVKNSKESIPHIQRWFRAERKKNFDMGTMKDDVT